MEDMQMLSKLIIKMNDDLATNFADLDPDKEIQDYYKTVSLIHLISGKLIETLHTYSLTQKQLSEQQDNG